MESCGSLADIMIFSSVMLNKVKVHDVCKRKRKHFYIIHNTHKLKCENMIAKKKCNAILNLHDSKYKNIEIYSRV